MLPRATDDAGATKCYFSSGPLPAFINAEQPPLKKKPLAALASNPFNQLVELILSREAYGAIEGELSRKLRPIRYGTVNLPPSALLEREFLSTHIKTGNLIMLSEGRLGVDDTYTLCDGILRLYLDRASYERSGLVGTPHGSAKAKRAKSRWVVEIKLRLPSMVHGKNGFKRIERAFAQVLTTSLSWRFCDPDDVATSPPRPIDRYHPIYRTAEPAVSATAPVHVPLGNTGTVPFLPLASDPSAADHPPTATRDAIEEWAIATHEWLSLISLGSPRVHAHDSIDPYLSRYAVPLPSPTTDDDGDRRPPPPQTLTRVQWRGLFPASWIVHLCIQTLLLVRSSARHAWFALSVHDARGGGGGGGAAAGMCTVLRLPQALDLPSPPVERLDGEGDVGMGVGVSVPAAEPSRRAALVRDVYVLWEIEGRGT